MQAGTNVHADLLRGARDGVGAPHRSRGCAVEHRQEPVSDRLHLVTRESLQLLADDGVVAGEKVAPALVAELGGPSRRVAYVGEEDREESALRLRDAPSACEELLDLV